MINLTPHTINVQIGNEIISFPPSGTVARVLTNETVISDYFVGNHPGIPVVSRTFGNVEGIPDNNSPILVSAMVLDAVKSRPNTFAPDTGKTAIRDEKGFIVAVTRLVAA